MFFGERGIHIQLVRKRKGMRKREHCLQGEGRMRKREHCWRGRGEDEEEIRERKCVAASKRQRQCSLCPQAPVIVCTSHLHFTTTLL